MEPRPAKEVIDQAIVDNRFSEWLLYVFAVLFIVVGLLVLIWGAYKGEAMVAMAGTIASLLFLPAMTSARRTRKENIAIRLLEAPLSRADTAKEAAEMLHHLVNEILSNQKSDK